MTDPLIAIPGGWELVLIMLMIVLLFGAKKLPELARGSGRALRIFKAETTGLLDDADGEDDDLKTSEQRELESGQRSSSASGEAVLREQHGDTVS